jgi:hypothetical protein
MIYSKSYAFAFDILLRFCVLFFVTSAHTFVIYSEVSIFNVKVMQSVSPLFFFW